jgi:GDP-mannose transporter
MSDEKKRDDYVLEMTEKSQNFEPAPIPRTPPPSTSFANNPAAPILAYCGSSILMTVTNKYVLSGLDFNLNFFLLTVQVSYGRSIRCMIFSS